MSMPKTSVTAKLTRRLMPLYVAAFFQGFVLFYPIEKIFMQSIGFDDASIGLMIASYSALMLLAETPSGILADRWSRKGVLILASLALLCSVVVGGLSDGVVTYLVCAGLWGLFFAFYSGTYDSIVYDTIYEETGTSRGYETYLGRVKAVDSAALIVSGLVGGLIANYLGLRYAYFLSAPFTLLSIAALLAFKEPKLHKLDVSAPLLQHIKDTFGAVLQKGQLRPVIVVLVTATVSTYTLIEFSQLWYIALALPVFAFGPLHGVLMAMLGVGGLIASRVKLQDSRVRAVFLLVFVGSSLGLVFFRGIAFLTIVSISVFCVCLICLNVLFTKLLQDSLSSKIRAGASSAVNTLSRSIIVPLSLLFGYVSRESSIFDAAKILAGLAIVVGFFIVVTYTTKRSDGKHRPSLPSSEEFVR